MWVYYNYILYIHITHNKLDLRSIHLFLPNLVFPIRDLAHRQSIPKCNCKKNWRSYYQRVGLWEHLYTGKSDILWTTLMFTIDCPLHHPLDAGCAGHFFLRPKLVAETKDYKYDNTGAPPWGWCRSIASKTCSGSPFFWEEVVSVSGKFVNYHLSSVQNPCWLMIIVD